MRGIGTLGGGVLVAAALAAASASLQRLRQVCALPVVPPRKSVGVLRAVQPANAAKRARKAAGIVGRKASKRFYREHRGDYVHA